MLLLLGLAFVQFTIPRGPYAASLLTDGRMDGQTDKRMDLTRVLLSILTHCRDFYKPL